MIDEDEIERFDAVLSTQTRNYIVCGTHDSLDSITYAGMLMDSARDLRGIRIFVDGDDDGTSRQLSGHTQWTVTEECP